MSKAAPPFSSSLGSRSWRSVLVFIVILPIVISFLVYRLDEFDPAEIPEQAWSWYSVSVPNHYSHLLNVTERLGDGFLPGPEDLVYNEKTELIYTGCEDGWIKRITLSESASDTKIENWIHVGGRPLGLAFGPDNELVIAEAYKGLLKVTREGVVQLLTNEAEGMKFGLIDAVDVAQNGVIYFTDASYKYNFKNYMLNNLEGRPYGRLLSYDPSTNKTEVLVRDIYFANGVAVSPQHDFVIFCETTLRRCRKCYVEGEKQGMTDDFIARMPGYPDNIRYDGDGKYWIGLISGNTYYSHLLLRYPFIRKALAILTRYVNLQPVLSDGGVLAVNLDGEAIALYNDPGLGMVSSGIRVKDHIYYGSLATRYIRRANLMHLTFANA
ncbi:Strictosidine synthase-like [Thalictrum thalictroides]|uniref:Strictosidine synthase-like n=1 Tax=Thalictrum thalictroides TaxID=46969 RepID=A0A7J6WYR9_THATH|nr:Strictosidine synthase-like [Thalictrum thalictroides]